MRVSGCLMLRAIVLTAATISLGACATASTERGVACVPVPEYRQEFLDSAADEVELLPADASAVVVVLEDYGPMRAQARSCSQLLPG